VRPYRTGTDKNKTTRRQSMNIRANAGTYALAGLLVLAYSEWGLSAVGKTLIVYAAFDLAIGIAGQVIQRHTEAVERKERQRDFEERFK
jgi:hypothetical protein